MLYDYYLKIVAHHQTLLQCFKRQRSELPVKPSLSPAIPRGLKEMRVHNSFAKKFVKENPPYRQIENRYENTSIYLFDSIPAFFLHVFHFEKVINKQERCMREHKHLIKKTESINQYITVQLVLKARNVTRPKETLKRWDVMSENTTIYHNTASKGVEIILENPKTKLPFAFFLP